MENNVPKANAEDILQESLYQMMDYVSKTFEIQTDLDSMLDKISGLLKVPESRDVLPMGMFDVKINLCVTIDLLALINLLASELNQILAGKQMDPLVTVTLSIAIFITSLLNLIQPELPVKLNIIDAKVYCSLLHMQEYRPINEPISQEEFEECVRQVGDTEDIYACLQHLEKKKLVCKMGNGYIVSRKVKVKGI